MEEYVILLNEEKHEINNKTFEWKQYLLANSEDNSVLHLKEIKRSNNIEELKKEVVRLNDSLGETFAIAEDSNGVCFVSVAAYEGYNIECRKTDNYKYKNTNLEYLTFGVRQKFSDCIKEMEDIYPRE